jgi:hypothetical protein
VTTLSRREACPELVEGRKRNKIKKMANKKCCGDCKNGKAGANHACAARLMAQKLEKAAQESAVKNLQIIQL